MNKLSLIALYSLLTFNSFANEALTHLQWGVKNTGQQYKITVGENLTETISGIPGIDINLPKNLGNLAANGEETIIAIIDSGLDVNHPDIKDSVWQNPVCNDVKEEERGKFPCHGWNLLDGNGILEDKVGHGTFIAGQIAALKNEFGIDGVVHNKIKLMGLKAKRERFESFSERGRIVTELFVNAIGFAIKNNAKVINLSIGFPKVIINNKTRAVFDLAMEKGIVIVAAAGNNNKDQPVFPCNYKNVICVGAIDARGHKTRASNFGHKVDIYAPGEKIVSTIPQGNTSKILRINNYDLKSGTSYAAPYVTALAALLKSKDPSLTVQRIREIIFSSARLLKQENGEYIRLVDFSSALNFDDLSATMNVKEVDEITVKKDQTFTFDVEVTSTATNIDFDIEAQAISQDFSVTSVKNIKDGKQVFTIDGKLKSLNVSSRQEIKLTLKAKDKILESSKVGLDFNIDHYQVTSRKLVKGFAASSLIRVGASSSFSLLERVLDRYSQKKSVDFYAVPSNRKDALIIFKENNDNYSKVIIRLQEKSVISSVIRTDANYDGKDDYIVYGVDEKKEHYFLSYFDDRGQPLFSGNYFKLISTHFGGLHFDRGLISFSLVRYKHPELGLIALPTFMREWTLPLSDNSDDPIIRLPNVKKNRPYYLLPEKNDDGQYFFAIRTYETFEFVKSIRNLFDIQDYEALNFNHIISQSKEERVAGCTLATIAFGEGAAKDTALLKFCSPTNYEILSDVIEKSFESNNVLRLRDSQKHYSDVYSFSTRHQRHFVRMYNVQDSKLSRLYFKSNAWYDLIDDVIDGFRSVDGETYYFEARSNIYRARYNDDGSKDVQSLPINRESSFPGKSFSQSYKSVLLDDGSLGVFTDTKSIFGDTVGMLRDVNGTFMKPISNTFKMKRTCATLSTTEVEGVVYLFSHCTDRKVSWIEKISFSLNKE